MDKEKGDWVISPIIYFHEELISLNEKSGTLNRTTLVEFIGLKFKKKKNFFGPAKDFSFFSREWTAMDKSKLQTFSGHQKAPIQVREDTEKKALIKSNLEVHPYINLHLLIDRGVDLHPAPFQRREAVLRHRYLPKLNLPVRHLMRFQRLELRATRDRGRGRVLYLHAWSNSCLRFLHFLYLHAFVADKLEPEKSRRHGDEKGRRRWSRRRLREITRDTKESSRASIMGRNWPDINNLP